MHHTRTVPFGQLFHFDFANEKCLTTGLEEGSGIHPNSITFTRESDTDHASSNFIRATAIIR